MKRIGIGIIGSGNVLEAYAPQCQQLASRKLASLQVVCGRPHQQQRALGLGALEFCTEPTAVVERDDIDLVVILTSIHEHVSLADAALRAGKHVLVEKPFAQTVEDAASLIELARSQERMLVCAPFTALSPTCASMASRLAGGDIGKPCLARARYGWSGPWWSDAFYKPGGGCIADLGIYSLTTLTALLGPVINVSCMAGVAVQERTVQGQRIRVEAEDNAQITLDFGNLCFGVVTTGFTMQQYRTPALEIYGSEGTIQMLGDDWDPDGFELWKNSDGCWRVFKETAPDWSWTDGLRETVEAVAFGTCPRNSPEHALHVIEVMQAARLSALEGRRVPVRSRFQPLIWPDDLQTKIGNAHLEHDRTRKHVDRNTSIS